jgi:hypothetical protein
MRIQETRERTLKILEQVSSLAVRPGMQSVPQALENILTAVRQLSNDNRSTIIKKDILPAINSLRLCANDPTTPPLVVKSIETMESWANYIVANPLSWRLYAERLGAHSKSLRILARVQTMGVSTATCD